MFQLPALPSISSPPKVWFYFHGKTPRSWRADVIATATMALAILRSRIRTSIGFKGDGYLVQPH